MRVPAGRFLPGLVVLGGGALLARMLGLALGINALFVAIGLGFVVANTVGLPDSTRRGVGTHTLWLAAGIVLMGATLTVATVAEVGTTVLALVLVVMGFTLVFVELLARTIDGVPERLGSLLAAGTSVCGVSAVVAVAGAARAKNEHVAYAGATILLFDAITIVVYPVVGELLGLSGLVFGIWAGVSMFSTGPVVAVGFSHSEVAGQWATIAKLTRNAFIGVIVVGYASYYARTGTAGSVSVRALWDEFPKFVLGFLALILVASVGLFTERQLVSIENAYNWLFTIAFVGLGTELRIATLRRTGVTPVLVVFGTLLVVSVTSLLVLTHLF